MDSNFPFEQFLKVGASPTKIPQQDPGHILNNAPIGPDSFDQNRDLNPLKQPYSAEYNSSIFNTLDQEPQLRKGIQSEAEQQEDLTYKIISFLKDIISAQKFDAFFKDTFHVKNLNEDRVVFSVTTLFIKKMIENHYLGPLKDAVENVFGKSLKIEIEVSPSFRSLRSNNNNILDSVSQSEPAAYSQSQSEALLLENTQKQSDESWKKPVSVKEAKFKIDLMSSREDLLTEINSKVISHMNNDENYAHHIDPKKTFDNFIVGTSNNMAFASAIAVSKNPGKVYPSLYLHSNSGLGKTHLLHAVGNSIKENHPTLKVCLITARDFMTEMIDAIANKKTAEFRRKYSEVIDVLMVDDVHELKNKQATQNEFFHVFNELHQKGKQLIFTSDKAPKEIDGLEERLKTRLTWGLVLDIQNPDLETRIAILKKKAQEEDIYLPEDVITYIASAVRGSIRELEGSLIRLLAYASVFDVDIDVEIAKEQLKFGEFLPVGGKTLDSVSKAVSQYFKIPVADLRSKARVKEVTFARHVAMHLSYKHIQATLSEIGHFYGRRDHTSVIHALDKIKSQILNDPSLEQTILDIERHI